MQNFNNLMRANSKMLNDDKYATSYKHNEDFIKQHQKEVAEWSKKQQEHSIQITIKEFKLYPKNKTILLSRAIEKAKELLTEDAQGIFNDEEYLDLFKKHFYRRLKESKIHLKQIKNLQKNLVSYLNITNILIDAENEFKEIILSALEFIKYI